MTPRENMAVVKAEPSEVAPAQPLTIIRPVATPDVLIAYHKEVTALVADALEKDRDYGVIPGTGTKPALLKAGAERLNLAFGAYPSYEIVEQDIDHERRVEWEKRKKQWKNRFRGDREFDWNVERGESLGLYRYVIRCILRRRTTDEIVGEGIGTASTLESKYIDRPRDCENTVAKMAQKRALVAATLNAYGLSDRFTQDVEDFGHDEPAAPPAPAAPPKQSAPQETPPAPMAEVGRGIETLEMDITWGEDAKGNKKGNLKNWKSFVNGDALEVVPFGRLCGKHLSELEKRDIEGLATFCEASQTKPGYWLPLLNAVRADMKRRATAAQAPLPGPADDEIPF